MLLKLKEQDSLSRRSIQGIVFRKEIATQVKQNFPFKKYSNYLEKVIEVEKIIEPIKEEPKGEAEVTLTTTEVDKILQDVDYSALKKAELVDLILEKFEDYTKTELQNLKKEVLIMILNGEFKNEKGEDNAST